MASIEQGRAGNPLEVVERKIHALYDNDAQHVISALEDSSLVVVTGPTGNGKTRHLIPEIKQKLLEQDRDVQVWEGQKLFGSSNLWFPPNPKNGVIIIDEAGGFLATNQEKAVREAVHLHGYQLSPTIARP